MDAIPQPGKLTFRDELTIQTADAVLRIFTAALPETLVLDLSEVPACDTAGLQLLCSLRKSALARGHTFRIAALSPAVQAAAAAVGLPLDAITGPDGVADGI